MESFDRFDYIPRESCSMKFNRYLSYSSRPKILSRNESIHIDIYEKQEMKYRGGYYLSILFVFLPVNRISTQLILFPSINEIDSSSNCSLKCVHEQCFKYFNKDKEFCQCFSGWNEIESFDMFMFID